MPGSGASGVSGQRVHSPLPADPARGSVWLNGNTSVIPACCSASSQSAVISCTARMSTWSCRRLCRTASGSARPPLTFSVSTRSWPVALDGAVSARAAGPGLGRAAAGPGAATRPGSAPGPAAGAAATRRWRRPARRRRWPAARPPGPARPVSGPGPAVCRRAPGRSRQGSAAAVRINANSPVAAVPTPIPQYWRLRGAHRDVRLRQRAARPRLAGGLLRLRLPRRGDTVWPGALGGRRGSVERP